MFKELYLFLPTTKIKVITIPLTFFINNFFCIQQILSCSFILKLANDNFN